MRIIISPAKKMKTEQELFYRLQQTAFPFGGGAAEKMDAGKDAGRTAAPAGPAVINRPAECGTSVRDEAGRIRLRRFWLMRAFSISIWHRSFLKRRAGSMCRNIYVYCPDFMGFLCRLTGLSPIGWRCRRRSGLTGRAVFMDAGDESSQDLEGETDVILNLASEELRRRSAPGFRSIPDF